MNVPGISAAPAMALVALCGCATPHAAAAGVSPGAGRQADADYYRTRAAVLEDRVMAEVARTDFVRFRRGRLYGGGGNPALDRALNEELTTAFDTNNHAAIVATTGRMLASDQTDIRAHMLRGIALRQLNRPAEADFHRAVAVGLLKSISASGDGLGFKSAWMVFQVKEEYELLKAAGYLVESQSLEEKGQRMFEVVEAKKPDGREKLRVYFDITELFAEGERRVGLRPATAP